LIERAPSVGRRAASFGAALALLVAGCSTGQAPLGSPNLTAAATPVGILATDAPSAPTASAGPSLSPEPTPGPTPVPGTGKITMTADRFAITLPDGWRQIPLDGSQTAEIEALLPAGSQITAALDKELASAVAAGFAFMAIDLRPATLSAGNISTVNVNVQAPSSVPLSLMEPLVTGLLDSAPGVSSVVAKTVTLPAGSQITAALDKELASAVAAGFAFMAIDLRPATLSAGNISTVNVNVQAPSSVPLSLMEPLVTGLLDSAPGVSSVVAKTVTLPAGKAIRITYTLTITTAGGQAVKLAATQFVLLSTKHTYTTSFACQYAAASSCRSQADAMMQTFDIL
jgi:hypothetical protein